MSLGAKVKIIIPSLCLGTFSLYFLLLFQEKGILDYIAHSPIIQVITVYED